MLKSVKKICPVCNGTFDCLECNDCWCFGNRSYEIRKDISDCLCGNCLEKSRLQKV